ncbi:hypothetical protein HU200_043280 [Digitaria exilis]|uniref:Uncharacterized protein n=1 Tax=Digitaria exilis TaxID=1010633 RepID=A0A835B3H1_9POAL|nr:hypothetical protein HU200_043280 [Digitaria exilis]
MTELLVPDRSHWAPANCYHLFVSSCCRDERSNHVTLTRRSPSLPRLADPGVRARNETTAHHRSALPSHPLMTSPHHTRRTPAPHSLSPSPPISASPSRSIPGASTQPPARPPAMAYSGIAGGGKMSAVDAILAEAADMIALEQIAKLNTAHLTDDSSSALPSALESRFRKLKSLPAAPTTPLTRTLGRSVTAPHPTTTTLPHPPPPTPPPPAAAPAAQQDHESGGGVHQEDEDEADKKSASSPPSAASSPPPHVRSPATVPAPHGDEDDNDDDLERLFGGSGAPRGRATLRERNRGRDDDDESTSPPPPRQACCFGFSPRKPTPTKEGGKKKKVHGSRDGGGDVLGVDAGEWGDENRRMVADLKEQQRKLKKALEEQVKVSRETAKMATWVKQASARMTHTAAIDDLLSDCEDDDELK